QNIIIFCCLTLITISVARGQISSKSPGNVDLILYRLERAQGRYIMSTSFELPEKGKFSLVVIGDTFSVRLRDREGMCDVIMSNAYIFQTTFRPSSSNQVVQTKFRTDA